MMLTIQGLPANTSYQELKRLIKQECKITDFILDSLVMDDNGSKKVRIGVTDDGDGSHLMKYLNGYHYSGHVIRVMPVGKPQNQQNPVSFDARGGYQQRIDYSNNNFANRAVTHDGQLPRPTSWVPNVQWGQQAVVAPLTQHAFPNQPVQAMVNNFTQQQPRVFPPVGIPQHAQNFGFAAKGNILDVPITTMKDNYQASAQFHHQSVAQGHFQGQANVQSTPWNSQVQPAKPQVFEKGTTGGYNQMGFNENRQMAKQGIGNDGGYKDYDKGERRFAPPNRDPSPGRRPSRMSPDPTGRRMSETVPQGRRMSPSGIQSRRMSPSDHQGRMSPPPAGPPGRRMSPGNHGRRMSPSRMGGPVPTGRVISPTPGRRMSPSRQSTTAYVRKSSPSVQGRRESPGPYRRASPSGPQGRRVSPSGHQGRRMSPHGSQGRRLSPPGPQGRRLSPSGSQARRLSPSGPRGQRGSHGIPMQRISPVRREPSSGRRISPIDRRRVTPVRQSPGRRGSPSRRLSPKRHSPGRRSASPRLRSPLLDSQAGMRGCNEGKEVIDDDASNIFTEDLFEEWDIENCDTGIEEKNKFHEGNSSFDLLLKGDAASVDDRKMAATQIITVKKNRDAYKKPEVREVFKHLSGAGKRRYKTLRADNVPWKKALEMCQKRWSQLPKGANPKKRARMLKLASLTTEEEQDQEEQASSENSYFSKSLKYAEVHIKNATGMSKEQSNMVRHALMSKILQLPKSDGPRIHNYGFKFGTLMVNCRDKQSQKWLVGKIANLQPWPGAKLSGAIIPVPTNPIIFHAVLPDSETIDVDKALNLFRIQNRGLNTEDWKVISSISVKAGLLITFFVDYRSLEILKEADFKVCLGLKTIRFKQGHPRKRLTKNKNALLPSSSTKRD